MQHAPLVCVEDAVMACELILQFTQDMTENDFCADNKTKAAVERKIEIIGFRNVIAHGYDVVEDSIVWESIASDIPLLLKQLQAIQNG